ncbi:MAG: c-type cytochrome biogenesis protein CcmI [Rhodospirillaceae bacterium]
MIWVSFALLTLLCVAILLLPIMRGSDLTADQTEADQAVYKAQLVEVERDLAEGVLTNAEAKTARIEIQRRLLAADRRGQSAANANTPALRMSAVSAVGVVVPFATLAIYLSIGSPSLPSLPVKERRAEALDHPDQADVNVLIENLADRLRENPDSTEGWVLLARSYRQANRISEAVTAYRRALSTGTQDIVLMAELGEVLIASNNGTVGLEAVNVLEAVLRVDRSDARARFYLGLARAQAGESRDAIAIWRDLTAAAPTDAPWIPMVREQMSEVAMSAGIMPMTVAPRHPFDSPGASEASVGPVQTAKKPESSTVAPEADEDDFRPDVSGIAGRFSRPELEMIQEMVGGLEARLEFGPEDFDGWMQLGRSYGVLGNNTKAANAYRQAISMRPNAVSPHVQLADLLLQSVGSADAITNEIVELSNKILALDGNNPDGLFISGLAAASAGNNDLARTLWLRLMNILPPSDSARDAVAKRLAELPG